MKLDVSESILEGYRLERVVEDHPGLLTIYDAGVASSGEPVSVRAFPVPRNRRARRAFRRAAERRVARAHAGLVPAREALEREGRLYLVTERPSGPALSARLEHGPLEPGAAIEFLERAAAAVEDVEWVADGIIGSSHIRLTKSSGRTRSVLVDPPKAVSLREIGWPWVHPYVRYAPPEIADGVHLGARSLVYSFGCILFECVTGSTPYEGDWLSLFEAHSIRQIPRLHESSRPELGPALDPVFARALAKDPADRFASAGVLLKVAAAALSRAEEAGGEGPTVSRRPPAAPPGMSAEAAEPGLLEQQPDQQPRLRRASEAEPQPDVAAGSTEAAPSLEEAASAEASPAEPEPAVTPAEDPERSSAPIAHTREQAARSELRDRSRQPDHARHEHPSVRADERGRARSKRMAGVICALAATCAFAGYLLGKADTPAKDPARATSGSLLLELPADWERRPPGGALPGVALRGTLAGGPRGFREAGIVAGRTQRVRSDFLPAGLSTPPGRAPEPVRLGRYEAYRLHALRGGGSGYSLTVYSVPTVTGAAVLACHTTPAAPEFLPECERVASTVRLGRPRPIRVSDLLAERRRLAREVAELRRRRSAGRRRLVAARRPAAQARTARALQRFYADARRSFAELDAASQPPGWRARLLTTVRRIELSYGRLAGAASRRSRPAYARARRSVRRSETMLARVLAGAAKSP